jgi:hypothetical protein
VKKYTYWNKVVWAVDAVLNSATGTFFQSKVCANSVTGKNLAELPIIKQISQFLRDWSETI